MESVGRSVGLSKATVSKIVADARKQWVAESVHDAGELLEIELRKLGIVKSEAWHAWRKSQGDDQTEPGDAAFLNTLLRCSERRSKLLGLEGPQRLEIATSEHAVIVEDADWYGNLDRIPQRDSMQEIDVGPETSEGER